MKRLALLILVALLVPAASAFGHARLVSTAPERGAVVRTQPELVSFRFTEPVEAAFGAIRVYDARGQRVEQGELARSGGDRVLGIGLRPGLPPGTYTATYRVISADGHPVSGGLVFSIGRAGAGSAKSVDELLGSADAGTATRVALGAAKALSYIATALLAGGLLFLLTCWRPPPAAPSAAAFERRARRLMVGGAALGLVAGAVGIVAQGAIAGGTSFWDALDPDVIGNVLDTRFGAVWGWREIAWLVLGVAITAGATRRLDSWATTAVLFVASCVVVAPALSGHPSVTSPRGLLTAMDVTHVAAMSAWVGGLVFLLAGLPAATRLLEPQGRAHLLADVLGRFSPIALVSVLALAVTGTVQAIVHLEKFGQLLDTAFGRAVLIKAMLVVGLAFLGNVNRRRALPRLRGAETPGAAGVLLRRTLRTEVALVVAVLGVTGALTGYPPPASSTGGPFSAREPLGPHLLELTVDPAQTGPNELHAYLFDRRTGAPFDGTKELRLSFTLPSERIGALPVTVRKAGPGHFVADTVALAPAGRWRLEVLNRVSDFDEYRTSLDVRIR